MLPSPPNASEPRRVCDWGRRAGDEGEWRLTDAFFICFKWLSFARNAHAEVSYLDTRFVDADSTGLVPRLPSPRPLSPKIGSLELAIFQGEGERFV